MVHIGRGGDIKKIADLFNVYKKRLRPPERTVVEAFQEAVAECTSFEVDSKHVSYNPHSRTVIVGAPGPVRSEIFLQKDEILSQLSKRLGAQNAPKHII